MKIEPAFVPGSHFATVNVHHPDGIITLNVSGTNSANARERAMKYAHLISSSVLSEEPKVKGTDDEDRRRFVEDLGKLVSAVPSFEAWKKLMKSQVETDLATSKQEQERIHQEWMDTLGEKPTVLGGFKDLFVPPIPLREGESLEDQWRMEQEALGSALKMVKENQEYGMPVNDYGPTPVVVKTSEEVHKTERDQEAVTRAFAKRMESLDKSLHKLTDAMAEDLRPKIFREFVEDEWPLMVVAVMVGALLMFLSFALEGK